ncbi:MAG: YkgJ family cysteine cluster protein [Ferruginibacter sp.]
MDINKSKNWQYPTVEEQKKYRQTLERTDKNKILSQLPALHNKAFENINCLTCANCCRNFSPRIKTPDLKRIARHLKMKEGAFIEKYLFLDEDGDYVVNAKPCPFLSPDNYCSIYDVRPSDCKRFPYTDEDVIVKRQNITIKNSSFCPIVVFVLDGLGKKI